MKINKRQIILDQAAKLFRQKGFAATSMRDLAKEVGMEAASLYNHIQSKQDILDSLLADVAGHYLDGMSQVEASGGGPVTQLRALVALHIRIAAGQPDVAALMTDEWRHLRGDAMRDFKQQRKDYEKRFRRILENGMARGELKTVDADMALFSILSTLRWFHVWYAKQQDEDLRQVEREFSDILISGIYENRSGSGLSPNHKPTDHHV